MAEPGEQLTESFSILRDALKEVICTTENKKYSETFTLTWSIAFQAQLVAWRKSQRDALLQGEAFLIYNSKSLSQLLPSLLCLFSTLLPG